MMPQRVHFLTHPLDVDQNVSLNSVLTIFEILRNAVTTVGYARVSSTGQDLAVQIEKLEAAGCDKIFKEKRSGVDSARPELRRGLDYLREGDTLLVTKIDRLARSTSDLYRIISALTEKGVAFKVT